MLKFLEYYLPVISDKSILVITSKIVSLAEGRIVEKISSSEKERIIQRESQLLILSGGRRLTIKDGVVMTSAGVDESNANGGLILLPRDSWAMAARVRRYFMKQRGLKEFGVIINDSRTIPLRAGISGLAIAYAGFKGLKDYRQEKDIFGRPFRYSRVNVADNLSRAAALCMGEGNEQRPLVLLSGAPVEYCSRVNKSELIVSPAADIYAPIFRKLAD